MEEIDVKALANLARIAVIDTEIAQYAQEMASIVSYVSTVQAIAATTDATQDIGPVHNVLRSDEVTNTPGALTKSLLEAAPQTEGQFIKVPKIISQD